MDPFETERDDGDSVELNSREYYYPDCRCVKFKDWDIHPKCHLHMGPHHWEALAANVDSPFCGVCLKLPNYLRYEWLSDYALAKPSTVAVDSHRTSQRAFGHATVGSGGEGGRQPASRHQSDERGYFPYDGKPAYGQQVNPQSVERGQFRSGQQGVSHASIRGREHLLANRSRVAASSCRGAPPGLESVRTDYVRRALPRSSSPAGLRSPRRASVSPPGERWRDRSPQAAVTSSPVAAWCGEMTEIPRYDRTRNEASSAQHASVAVNAAPCGDSRLTQRGIYAFDAVNAAGHGVSRLTQRNVEERVGTGHDSRIASRLGPHPSLADHGAVDLSSRARVDGTAGSTAPVGRPSAAADGLASRVAEVTLSPPRREAPVESMMELPIPREVELSRPYEDDSASVMGSMVSTATSGPHIHPKLATRMSRDLRALIPRAYVSAKVSPPPSYEDDQVDDYGVPCEDRRALTAAVTPSPRFLKHYVKVLEAPLEEAKVIRETDNTYESVPVEGFIPSKKAALKPELEFLSIFPPTKHLTAEDPSIPTAWMDAVEKQARASWQSGTRSAALSSVSALLVSHLNCMVNPKAGEQHAAALMASGLQAGALNDFRSTADGERFLGELTRIGNHLALLGDDQARVLAAGNVASNHARKLLWLHQCGFESGAPTKTWATYPVPFGKKGLFQATEDRLKGLKEKQERRTALSVEIGLSGVPVVPTRKDSERATTTFSSSSTTKATPSHNTKVKKAKRAKRKRKTTTTEQPPPKKPSPGNPGKQQQKK